MIIFFDPKTGRGGGQVVLESLLEMLSERVETALVMPPRGREALRTPASCVAYDSPRALLKDHPWGGNTLVVANANASFPDVVAVASIMRRRRRRVSTAGIIHNYPAPGVKSIGTHMAATRLGFTIAVEPGLASVSSKAIIPSWLSLPPGEEVPVPHRIHFSGEVKSYGRPDRSKGLHLLPQIYQELEASGLRCSVALGQPLEGQLRYQRQLRHSLSPWLEDGPRTIDWVKPGDIFVIPSISGEAACLTAQEALAKGAWVIASRVGLMPYLSPTRDGIDTFPPGDAPAASDAIVAVSKMDGSDFTWRLQRGMAQMNDRRGRWYRECADILVGALSSGQGAQ